MVDVEPGNPNLFWSASEDGSIRQFDLRLSNQREHESPNVLLTVQKAGTPMELLAAKLNKVGFGLQLVSEGVIKAEGLLAIETSTASTCRSSRSRLQWRQMTPS